MGWPDNADGNVFRILESNDFNFSIQHIIEFNIDFQSWPPPAFALNTLSEKYGSVEVVEPEEEEGEYYEGYYQFTVEDYLNYDLVIKVQEEATELMKQFGGVCESWGVLQSAS